MHSFLEDNESGLHMLETLSARRVLQNLPAYKVASNKKKDDLNVDLDDHSLVIPDFFRKDALLWPYPSVALRAPSFLHGPMLPFSSPAP